MPMLRLNTDYFVGRCSPMSRLFWRVAAVVVLGGSSSAWSVSSSLTTPLLKKQAVDVTRHHGDFNAASDVFVSAGPTHGPISRNPTGGCRNYPPADGGVVSRKSHAPEYCVYAGGPNLPRDGDNPAKPVPASILVLRSDQRGILSALRHVIDLA